jgi:hypothetical protein
MEIKDFLELYSGKWFSQKTHYNLAQQLVENGKADLIVELLSSEDAMVKNLCSDAIGGLRTSWDTSVDWNRTKQIGSYVLVFGGDGQLFTESTCQGSYRLEQDEMLILTMELDKRLIEERIWFPSPNFRLRTTIVQQNLPQTSFYSEIRKLSSPSN